MFNFIFTADKASKKPLYEQLYSYVADEIKNKNIKENERMPSKKALAKYLGISVNTVETAYSGTGGVFKSSCKERFLCLQG